MPTARTQPRTAARRRPTTGRRPPQRPAGSPMSRMPRTSPRPTAKPRTSAKGRKPARTSMIPRRKQQPQSLGSKAKHNAIAGLLGAGGAAKKAGQNKSKVALLAGLGAAGAAVLKKRRAGSDTGATVAETTPPTTTVVDDPRASVPVAPAATDGVTGTAAPKK